MESGLTLKIIVANRSNCISSPGGDTVQMLKTIEYLKKNDIDVNMCLSPEEIIKDNDSSIVHIFNIQTIDETLEFIKVSKSSGKKIVLSPIYWDLSHSVFVNKMFEMFNFLNNRHLKKLKNICFNFTFFIHCVFKIHNNNGYGTKGYLEKRKKALSEADFILPNSNEEFDILCKEFRLEKETFSKKTVIIPNAVEIERDKVRINCTEVENHALGDLKDFILEVGRIEINKNQYGIVKSLLNRPEIPIVFIGRIGEGKTNIDYYYNLKKIAKVRGNIFFINQIPQEEVFEYYKRARVHVLPSFRESPGLSSLEALFFGCEIVTSSSEFCPIDYYKFNKKAHICDPYNIKSIKNAILDAYYNPKNTSFDEEYFEFFSYRNVSYLMKQIYDSLT